MTKERLIKTALDEVGYLEKSLEAYKKDPQIIYQKGLGAGRDNITKYNFEMHKIYPQTMDFAEAWCDAFVDWCFYKTFGVATAKSLLAGGFDDYTVASADMYKNKKAYHKGTDGIRSGDQVFFKNSKRICHTALVIGVDSKMFYTVEGNTNPQESKPNVVENGGGVWTKEYPLGFERVDGYGRPPYEKHLKVSYPTWVKDGSAWYYRISEGQNAHGWRIINGHWYYFLSDGKMVTGKREIKSEIHGTEKYFFEESGDFEGALNHTNLRGALEIWDI